MALETPTWLNLCFVEKILRKSEDDNSIQMIDIFSKPATSKGDNYASDIIRINTEFLRDQGDRKITEKKSIIVKIAPTVEGVRQDFVIQSGIFKTEILMMSDTLDKMNELLEPKYRLSGKCLYVQKENPMFLVIEDLAPLGFRLADRSSGLDLAHSVLAIRGLARFHAASVAICEKEPKQKKMYSGKGMFSKEHPPNTSFSMLFNMSVKGLVDEIANWPEGKKYSEKIAKFADRTSDIGMEASKLSEDEFNVINHGDFWANNMLFKYDNDGNPTDYISVDFQISVYTSPAVDLHFFFNTSLSLELIENKEDILLNEYLSTLSTTMKQLKCETQPPTKDELKATLKRRAGYGMIVSFVVLPLMLCCKSEAKDLDEILGTGTAINPGFKTENFKKIMAKKLPLYDEWGLLDL